MYEEERRPKSPKLINLSTDSDQVHLGHLPQGAPTSDRLANLHLATVAERLEAIFRTLDLTPSAYVDDIAFSGVRTREAFRPVIDVLMEIGLSVRNGKCENAGASRPHTLTGYITNDPSGPKVSQQQRSRIRAIVHRLICDRRNGLEARDLELSVRGHLAHLKRTNAGEAARLHRQLLKNGIDVSAKLTPKPRPLQQV